MHVADQRHGLDVVASLRAAGRTDPDLLLAGLLHDAGKGQTGVWPRVAWSLGERVRRVGLAGGRAVPGHARVRSRGSVTTPSDRRELAAGRGMLAR